MTEFFRQVCGKCLGRRGKAAMFVTGKVKVAFEIQPVDAQGF